VITGDVFNFHFIRSAVIGFLIVTESMSILENYATLGLPIPSFLSKYLDVIKENIEGGAKDAQ
jgi:phage-related holin